MALAEVDNPAVKAQYRVILEGAPSNRNKPMRYFYRAAVAVYFLAQQDVMETKLYYTAFLATDIPLRYFRRYWLCFVWECPAPKFTGIHDFVMSL